MPDAPEGQKVLYLCTSVGLVLMAGLMSGLTLGLMSLDQVDLEVGLRTRDATLDQVKKTPLSTCSCPNLQFLQVLIRSGTAKEKKYAARISPVRKDAGLAPYDQTLCCGLRA